MATTQPAPSIIFENERVCVKDFHLGPAEKNEMHSHPDYVILPLDDFVARMESPDGSIEEMSFEKGQPQYHEAETHKVENLGDKEAHAILIELK